MLIAKFLSTVIPLLGTALLALILGIIARQFITNFTPFNNGISWTEKYVLEIAIVFIGFGFEFTKFQEIGINTIVIISISITSIVLFSFFLQKRSKQKQSKLFILLGIGNAICGSSAIAASAPILKSKEEETGISLAVINILGLAGMLILPFIGNALNFSNLELGIFIGGILQSVGHVVGAGFAISNEVGEFATVVKMGRVAFLVPFILILYFISSKNKENVTLKFPMFIIFFMIAVGISQIDFLKGDYINFLSKTGDMLINIGMAAIGLKINIKSLWSISGSAFLIGSIIFVFQIEIYLIYLIS